MSHSVNAQPFDLRIGDEVDIIVPGGTESVTGKITMAAAPVYEIRLDEGCVLSAGSPVRCEPRNCPRNSRILASVIGNRKNDTTLWVTAMELKVGVERAKRFSAMGAKANISDGVGTVALRDVSASGLSFYCGHRLVPGQGLRVEIVKEGPPLAMDVLVVHVSQDVGVAVATVGCKIESYADGSSDVWNEQIRILTAPLKTAKAS